MGFLTPSFSGDALTGAREPLSGSIRDLRVAVTGFATAEAEVTPVFDNPGSHELGVYIDGFLRSRLASNSISAGLTSLLDGNHSLAIIPLSLGAAIPDYHGDDQGQRVYLTWARCTDTSCRAYKVYWDAGAGGAADTLLATVTEVAIGEAINKRGAEGEDGRITYYGGFSSESAVNDVIILTLANDGTYSYTCQAGTGSGAFVPGQSLALPYGVWVQIQDVAAAYGVVSTFTVPVGPANFYLTDELAPGDYQFTVKAVDEPGNESAALATRTVRIVDIPDELPGVTQTWNNVAKTMTVAWNAVTAAALGITAVNVYANYSDVYGFAEYVIEDMPYATVAVEDGEIVFDHDVTGDGELRLYLRSVNAAGHERRSLAMVRFNLPATAFDQDVQINTPVNVQVTALAAGALRVSFDYTFEEEGDDTVGFEIGVASSSGAQIFGGVLDLTDDDGTGVPVGSFSIDLAGPYVGTQYVVVRAYAAGLAVYNDSEEAQGVPDSTAPTFAGELHGVSQ